METCKKNGKVETLSVYKCCFNAYSRTVVSICVRAYSVSEAIEQCKIILGESTVKCCLMSVELVIPF